MNHQERFDEKYIPEPNSGCWIWEGALKEGRYGCMRYHGVPERAHRVSYQIHVGEIPDGLHVLHKCDNTLCVNPSHLYLGTHYENMQDRKRKGRYRSVPQKDIDAIQTDFLTGKYMQKDLAEKYNYRCSTISRIVNNKR